MEPKGLGLAAVLAMVSLLGSVVAQGIRVDGSSTLYPVLAAAAAELAAEVPETPLQLGFSGTRGGFDLFCTGQAAAVGASRPINDEELEACSGTDFIELPLGFDSITVVVNEGNDWAECLSAEELAELWRPRSTKREWSDIRPQWPDEEIVLFAPGVASGTHDYFAAALLGPGNSLRTNFYPSEDDALLVEGVAGDTYALGFFGYAYYLSAGERLRAVAIDYGSGCVDPGLGANVLLRSPPLLRVLYLYVDAQALAELPLLERYVELLLSERGREIVADVGYLPLPGEMHRAAQERFASRVTGSAELGVSSTGATPGWPQ